MTSAPRIVRAAPKGPVSTPAEGIPVNVLIRWYSGEEVLIPALAVAWTKDAVEIQWSAAELGMRRDWVPAEDVSRPDPRGRQQEGGGPGHSLAGHRTQRPPPSRDASRKRQY